MREKSGKHQAWTGLYFTEDAPSIPLVRIALTSLALEIPAGETNYVVQDSFVLPVDARVAGILPHAHFSLGVEQRELGNNPAAVTREAATARRNSTTRGTVTSSVTTPILNPPIAAAAMVPVRVSACARPCPTVSAVGVRNSSGGQGAHFGSA